MPQSCHAFDNVRMNLAMELSHILYRRKMKTVDEIVESVTHTNLIVRTANSSLAVVAQSEIEALWGELWTIGWLGKFKRNKALTALAQRHGGGSSSAYIEAYEAALDGMA
eukprot:3683-Amphidinium_carterae.2